MSVVVEDQVTVSPSPDSPGLNVSSVNPASCGLANGSLTVAGTGGVPGYTYSIDGGLTFQASGTFSGLSTGSYTIVVSDVNGCLGSGEAVVGENTDLDVQLNQVHVTCFGANDGQITAQGVAGTGSYSYSLNGGTPNTIGQFTNLGPGSYTIVVTDSDGCVVEGQIQIDEPNELLLTLVNSDDISCFGLADGQIEVTAAGGAGNFAFQLNGGVPQPSPVFSQLIAGNYTVSVTDNNGCSASLNVALSQPNLVEAFINYPNPQYCPIGNANVIQTGPTGGVYSSTPAGLSINSSTGTVNLGNSLSGLYTVNYQYQNANGCVYSTQTVISVLDRPMIDAGADTSICEGQQVQLMANGGVSYSWQGGYANGDFIQPGVGTFYYVVLGTDANGCQALDTVYVTVHPYPQVSFEADPLTGNPPLVVNFENTSDPSLTELTWNFEMEILRCLLINLFLRPILSLENILCW